YRHRIRERRRSAHPRFWGPLRCGLRAGHESRSIPVHLSQSGLPYGISSSGHWIRDRLPTIEGGYALVCSTKYGRSHRMKLYTYWRSQASFRVRIALRLKGLVAETVSLDLLKGDQFDAAYRALNPEMVVPTLLDGDGPPLVQSLAILEYLEEKHP